MRDVSRIILWVSQIPNLGAYVLVGVMGGVISAAAIRLLAHLSGNNPGYEHVSETSVPAAVHTAERYAAAWRDRKRRFFVFKTVQLSMFALVFVLFLAAGNHPHVSSGVVVLPVFGGWFITYMVAGVWLNRFRCPRCGKLYYWRWELKGSVERQKRYRDCHYCGLKQDQMPE